MLLNTFNAGTGFIFGRNPSISFAKPAVEAELKYLADFDSSSITVEESGSYLVLEGCVRSPKDLYRALKVAGDVVGAENVICQLAVVGGTVTQVDTILY